MQKLILILCGSALAMGILVQPGYAIPQFHKEFVKLYLGDSEKKPAGEAKPAEEGATTDDLEEIATGSKTKCFVCHQGKKRKNQNSYGKELAKLLDKKKDKKDVKKIIEALETVAKIHTDPKDKKSPTYGDLIKAGKSPGGTLEAAKKEPKGGSDKKDESGEK